MKKATKSILSIFLIILLLIQPTISLAGDSTNINSSNTTDTGLSEDKPFKGYGLSGGTVPAPSSPTIPPAPEISYTVIFNDWDGTQLSVQQIKEGEAAVAPVPSPREGYRFTGWSQNADVINADITVVAQYEVLESYTITINYVRLDNTMVHGPYVVTVVSGDAFDATIPSPVINGYQADKTSMSISEESVTENIDLFVYYTPASDTSYKVEHYQQNLSGTGNTYITTDNLSGETGQLVVAEAKSFTGFTPPATMPTGVIAADGSTVLKVYYTRNISTLYFDSAGGSYVTPITKLFGDTVTLPTQPTKAGYAFAGWTPSVPNVMPATNQNYTATWTVKGTVNYSVVHWLERPDSSGYDYVGREQKSGAAGSAVAVPTGPPSTITFPIASTYFTIDTAKTNSSKPDSILGDGTTILNVYYSRNVYTMSFSFDANMYTLTVGGVTYNTSPYQFSAKLGADITNLWPSNPPQLRPGKISNSSFVGWSGPNLPTGGNNYITRQLILQTNHISDKNFAAAWSLSTKKIVVHYWFMNLSGTGYTEDYTQTINISSNTNQFSAKAFQGFVVQQSPLPVAENIYFMYNRLKYSMTFYNGGNVDKQVGNLPYQSSIANQYYEPSRPSNVGTDYLFSGWYTTPQGYDDSKFNFNNATISDANLILYARWDKPVYTVTFDTNNGGANPPTQMVPLQNKVTRPTDPVRAGYYFAGWYLQGETLRYIFDYPVVKNLNLIAHWTPSENISYTINYDVPGQSLISETISGNKTGDIVTAVARNFEGFIPDQVSKSITIAPENNVITFKYTHASEPAVYKIQYLYQDTKETAMPEEVKTTTQNQVVVNYKPLSGYYPDRFQKTLQISKMSSENIIVFYYSKNPDVKYTVNHYQETITGSYILFEEEERYAGAGTQVLPPNKYYENFTFNKDISSIKKVIASNGSTVFNYYYNRNLASIRFITNGYGTLQGTTEFRSIRYGTPFASVVTVPTVIPDLGYVFFWSQQLPNDTDLITESVIYTANFVRDEALWTKIQYKINSTSATGSMKDSDPQLIGSSYTLVPNEYTNSNYTFTGWNTKPDGSGISYGDAQTITIPQISGILELYAQWVEKDKFSILYSSNGGAGEINDTNVYYYNDPVTIKNSSGFTYPGFSFKHWNTSSDNLGKTYTPNQQINVSENLLLYAIWERKASDWSTIKFKNGNPSATGSMEDVIVLRNNPHQLEANYFELKNYDFIGWRSNLNDTIYQPGSNYEPTEEIIEMTAQWREHDKYPVNFYANYPQNTDSNSVVFPLGSYYSGEEITIMSNTLFSYRNYTMVEWNTSPNGSGQRYAPSARAIVQENLNLYAIWKENPSFRVFYENSSTGTVITDPVIYYVNNGISDHVKVQYSNFSNHGYQFAFWDLYQDNVLMVSNVSPDEVIENLAVDTVFRTVWNPASYHLSYDLDGGILISSNPTLYTIESDTFVLNNPSKPGYKFLGWQDAMESEEIVKNKTIFKGSTGDKEYKAIWEKDISQWSKITFRSENTSLGSLVGILTYEGIINELTTDVIMPETNPASGYKFSYWENPLPNTYPSEDMEIIAHWTRDDSKWKTISFVSRNTNYGILAGETIFEGITEKPTDNIIYPEPVAQPGYTFSGWSIDLPKVYGEDDLIIYANWEIVDKDWSTITYDPGNTTMGSLSGTLSFKGPKGNSTNDIVVPSPQANKGYRFVGWSVPLPDYYSETSLLITAQWERDTSAWSTIRFESSDTNMGSLSGEMIFEGLKGTQTDGIVNYPSHLAVSGYSFSSWSEDIPENFPENDKTITAYWIYDPSQWSTVTFGVSNPLMGTLSGTNSYTGIIGHTASISYPTVVENPGYSFVGWSETTLPQIYPQTDKTIIANLEKDMSKWSEITFDNSNTEHGVLVGKLVLEGIIGKSVDPADIPIPQAKPGYVFSGWSQSVPTTYPTTNITISPIWAEDPAQWTEIKFASSDLAKGTLLGSTAYRGIIGTETSSVIYPIIQLAPGYQLEKWSSDIPARFPAENLQINATFEKSPHGWTTVTFVTEDPQKGSLSGEVSFTGFTGTEFSANNVPSPIPNHGYQFDIWESSIPTEFPATDLTIVAKWKILPNEWGSILFSPGVDPKGTLSGQLCFTSPSGDLTDGTVVEPYTIPVKGYIFKKWNKDIPDRFPLYPDNEVIIEAVWEKNPAEWATITFENDQPAKGSLRGTFYFEGVIGSSIMDIVPPVAMPEPGHQFAGWKTSTSSDWTMEDLGGAFPSSNLVVTPKWERKTDEWSKISFVNSNKQQGTVFGKNEFEGVIGQPLGIVTPPLTIPMLGYQFAGWSTSSNTSWTIADLPADYPRENLVITANWEKIPDSWSTIRFESANPDMGTLSGTLLFDGIIGDDSSIVTVPKTLPKAGYKFKEWSDKIPETFVDSDIVIYARFEKDKTQWSNISFTSDANKGTLTGILDYEGIKDSSTTAIVLPTPTAAAGFEFVGWDLPLPDTYPSSDLEIRAIWKDKAGNVTITFVNRDTEKGNINGTLIYSGAPGTSTSHITLPEISPNRGYEFGGWSTTVPKVFPDRNLEIIAKWEITDATTSGGSSNEGGTQTKDTGPNKPKLPETHEKTEVPEKEKLVPPNIPQKPSEDASAFFVSDPGEGRPGEPDNHFSESSKSKDEEIDEFDMPESNDARDDLEETTLPDETPTIPDNDVEGYFVPINLIITIIGVLVFILSIISQFRSKIHGEKARKRIVHIFLTISEILGVGLVVLYLATATFGPQFVLYDKWTIWLGIILLIQAILYFIIFSRKFEVEMSQNEK